MNVSLKYGLEEIRIRIPQKKLVGIFVPKEVNCIENGQIELKMALKNPLGSKRLKDIVNLNNKVAIVIDDITRPLPSQQILPLLIDELISTGVKKEDITIIIATGLHRKLTNEEINTLVGKEIANKIKVINHDPYSDENLVYLGKTSRSSSIYVNRSFMEADIKILVGDIEFHQFFGYAGGIKSVHPGIADAESIRHIHSQLFSHHARMGVLNGNPIQDELKEVIRMVRPDFTLNVVLNLKGKIVRAFAGDLVEVFYKGVKLVDEMYKIRTPRRVDTVIVSCGGFPRDINLYQSQKAIESAKRMVKRGGKIILFARCQEGWGSKTFEEWMKKAKNPEEVIGRIKKNFVMGAHKAYLFAEEVRWAEIYIYSEMSPSEVENAFLHPLTNLEEVDSIVSKSEEVAVLPYATTTLPWVEDGF